MDFTTDYLTGSILEWLGEPYDANFGIQMRGKHEGFEGYTFSEFWADTIVSPPTGSIYHDGFLIVHSQADGLALMADLEAEYASIVGDITHTERMAYRRVYS